MKNFKRTLAAGAFLLSVGETAYPEPVKLDSRAVAVERLTGISAAMRALSGFLSEENEKNVLFIVVGEFNGEYIYERSFVTGDQIRDQFFELRDEAETQSPMIAFTIFETKKLDEKEHYARAKKFIDITGAVFATPTIYFIDVSMDDLN